jgi:hypothetical protein
MKKQKKNLFRVDAHLSYLIYTDKETYGATDFCEWLKINFHSGELDEEGALEVEKVESTEQIQDFLDRGYDYSVYTDLGDNTEKDLPELVDELGLDATNLIAKLRKLGYTIAPPKKK